LARKPIDDRKEELRGLFVLGLLAVFAAVRVQYSSFEVQLGHLSLDIIPIINMIIILWSLYAFFMVLGLSEDVIGKTIADAFRDASRTFLLYNFLLLALIMPIFGIVGFPHFIYLFGFMGIFIVYWVVVKLRERRGLKKPKKKRAAKGSIERRQSYSIIALLICSTIIMYVQNEIVAFSVFIVGVVAVFVYLYFQEQLRKKKASQQLLGNSD
jgi:hypothetical protein